MFLDVALGALTMLSVFLIVSKDVLFGALVVVLIEKALQCLFGQGQIEVQNIQSYCSCVSTKGVSCRYHDVPLLRQISKHITNDGLLYEIGINLHIEPNVIDTCRSNYRDINEVAFHMLKLWYSQDSVDGLGPNSQGVVKLRNAAEQRFLHEAIEINHGERM